MQKTTSQKFKVLKSNRLVTLFYFVKKAVHPIIIPTWTNLQRVKFFQACFFFPYENYHLNCWALEKLRHQLLEQFLLTKVLILAL